MIYYFVVLVLLKVKYMKFSKKEIFTIPNILTYIRILCVPFFIWFMLDTNIPNNVYIAFGLFMFASITDMVDGFIARHYHLISDIGKIADPIADKLLQVSTMLCLTIIAKISWVFPMVFFIKETYMVLGGSAIVKIFKSDYVLQSNIFGKGATCLNSLGIVLAFFKGEVNNAYDIAVNVILMIGATFAIVTATIYTMQFFAFRKKELARKRLKAVPTETNTQKDVIVNAQVESVCECENSVHNVDDDCDCKLDTNKKCDCDTGEDNNNVLLKEKQESDT